MPFSSPRQAVSSELRRARVAVSLLFFTNGAIPANLIPRLPVVKAQLGLTNAEFGLAVAAGPIGALVSGLFAGMLIRRFRSSRVAVASMLLAGIAVILAGSATSWGIFAGAFFFSGAIDAVADVAQNSHGFRVQRGYGRSIINSFHAVWSIGAVTGGLMGAGATALRLSLPVHLMISAGIFAGVNLVCYRYLLAGREPVEMPVETTGNTDAPAASKVHHRLRPYVALLALGAIAVAGSFGEDTGNTWATLYLSEDLQSSATVAAFGFIALAGMQFIGRMTGDRIVDRFGQRRVARTGGAITAIGLGLALAFPTIPGTVAGFGAVGFGIATLVPSAMEAADRLPGLRPGTGLTILSWIMRVGFLISPPVVGFVADAASLRVGLLLVPLGGVVVVSLAGALPRRKQDSSECERIGDL